MKRVAIALFLLLLIPGAVWATPDDKDIDSEIERKLEEGANIQINALNTREWDEFMKSLKDQGNTMIKETHIKDVIQRMVYGDFDLDLKNILRETGNLFFQEVVNNLGWIGQIIIVSIICGILSNLKSSFNSEAVGELAWFASYMIVIILIIQSVISILDVGRQAIEHMVMFMQILFPILLTLLIAMGGIASSGVMQPAIALLVGTVSTFLKNTMLPLILFSAVLVLVNHASDKLQLNRLSKLIKNLCSWTLGGLFTVFIGVLTIQGALAASFDGVSIRTAKYAIETFVPIVGGMFSQTVDVIIGCSLLIKNAVGVAGLIVIAVICIYPCIKILSLVMVYKLSSALLEPVSDARIVDCLNDIGNVLTVLFITVAGVAVMFFLTVTLLIGAGNVTVMMR